MAAMDETDPATQEALLGATLTPYRVFYGVYWFTSRPDGLDLTSSWECSSGCNFPQDGRLMLTAFDEDIGLAEFQRVEEVLDLGGAGGYPFGFAVWKGKAAPNLTISQFALFDNAGVDWHGLVRVGGAPSAASRQTKSKVMACNYGSVDTPECKLWGQWIGDKNVTATAALFSENARIIFYTDEEGLVNYNGAAETFAQKLFDIPNPDPQYEDVQWVSTSARPGARMLRFQGAARAGTPLDPYPNYHSFVMTEGDRITIMCALQLSASAQMEMKWV